jgi:hypothetical protein
LFPFPGRDTSRKGLIVVSPSRTSLCGLLVRVYSRRELLLGVVIAFVLVLISGVAWWVASARKAGLSLSKKNYGIFCGPTDKK